MTCLVGFYFSPKSTGGFVDCVGLILVQPTIVDQFLHPERPRVWNLEVLLATYVFKWFSSGWFQPMWKICARQIGSFSHGIPMDRGENKRMKPPVMCFFSGKWPAFEIWIGFFWNFNSDRTRTFLLWPRMASPFTTHNFAAEVQRSDLSLRRICRNGRRIETVHVPISVEYATMAHDSQLTLES